MTTRQLKDTNWASARKSIMAKYDTNGDGKFDQGEVEGIIDDYMGTIYNKQSLQDANQSQRKIIIFGTIMIVLLTLSNLGTGIAAAYIAKDIKVVDGKMMPNGGDDEEEPLMTRNAVKTFEIEATEAYTTDPTRRRMQATTDGVTVGCIDPGMYQAIGTSMANMGSANLAVYGGSFITEALFEASSTEVSSPDLIDLVSLYGTVNFSPDGTIMDFPASSVKIDQSDPECLAQGKFGVKLMPRDNCSV